MSPLALRVAWIIGGAVALLWFAGQRGSSSGGGGGTGFDPETGWSGSVRFSDLARSLAPTAAIIPGGYDPCNYFFHEPTQVMGTLQQVSTHLGVSLSDWIRDRDPTAKATEGGFRQTGGWTLIYKSPPEAGCA